MLGGTNYYTYMGYDVIKNCDVRVFPNTTGSTYFLYKANIISFRMERTNNGIIDQAPNDNVVIEIANWTSISSTYRDIMLTKGAYLKIAFVVENTQTDYCIVECVKDCKVNKRKNTATLTLQSPFALMSGYNFVAEVKGYIQDRSSFPFVEETFDNYDSFPLRVKTTFFESVQIASISKGQSARIKKVAYNAVYPPDHKTTQPAFNQKDYYELVGLTGTTSDLSINVKSITSDISESIDENDRSNIYFFGLKTGTRDQLCNEYMEVGSNPNYPNELVLEFKFGENQYVITDFHVNITHAGTEYTDEFYYRISNNSFFAIAKNSSQWQGYSFYGSVYGYKAEELTQEEKEAILDGQDYVYTFSPALLNGGTKLATAQANARSYYGKRTYIEFDCRLDPRIEPMDVINVSGVGRIRVEKVTMQFNGAFKGHIKGRLVYAE